MERTKIELGDIVKHHNHGYTGVVIGRTRVLNNCDQLTVQPRVVKDGKPIESLTFDEPNLLFVEKSELQVMPAQPLPDGLAVGDRIKDKLTGLEGRCMSITTWINGCSRLRIEPAELKDGVPVASSHADAQDVVVLERGNREKVKTGGPRPEPQRR